MCFGFCNAVFQPSRKRDASAFGTLERVDDAGNGGGKLYSAGHRLGLLCLNLRHEHVARASVFGRAEREMAWFRAAGRPIFHAYVWRPRDQASQYGALPGLEPLWNEPVFALAHASALTRGDAAMIGDVQCLRVIGDAYGPLAHAISSAVDADWVVVADACFEALNFHSDGKAEPAHRARDANKGENIVWLASWRT